MNLYLACLRPRRPSFTRLPCHASETGTIIESGFFSAGQTIIGTTVVEIGRPYNSQLWPASLFARRTGAIGV